MSKVTIDTDKLNDTVSQVYAYLLGLAESKGYNNAEVFHIASVVQGLVFYTALHQSSEEMTG